jgi:hypothetical protein
MPATPFCFRIAGKGFLLQLTVLPILLTACSFGGQEKQSGKNRSAAEKTTVMDTFRLSQLTVPNNTAYNAVLENFDKSDLQNIDCALIIFSNSRADSLARDSMLISFNEFMASVMQEYYDRKLLGNRELGDRFRNKEDRSEAQKLTISLAKHGINILFRDGEFYLEPDQSFIYKHLESVLTAGSRNYLKTKVNIANGFINGDNQPVSPPDSLARQVIVWEDFMLKYPEYLMKDEIQTQYVNALAVYLSGNEQFPPYDPNTKMLDPKYQSSYLRYIEEYPNRESTKIVKKYYDLLASKGFKYSEGLDSILSEVNFNPTQNPQ